MIAPHLPGGRTHGLVGRVWPWLACRMYCGERPGVRNMCGRCYTA